MSRALLALALLAGGLGAQARFTVPHDPDLPPGRAVEATVTTVTASVRPGGLGHVRVELHNPDTAAHEVLAEVADAWFDDFRVTGSVRVDGGARARLFLPLPGARAQARIELRADGADPVRAGVVAASFDPGVGVSVLLVAGATMDAPGWEAMLKRRAGSSSAHASASRGGDPRAIVGFQVMGPGDLPPDGAWISGFDLVVVDGRAAGLDDAAQRALRDYLRAGGRLLAVELDAMPDGPLRATLREGGAALGFGMAHVVATGAPVPGGPLAPADEAALHGWLERADGALVAGARPTSGPLPPAAFQALEIPGLGRVPLRLFFLLIIAFAVVVGPVNYLYWRRRRRLPMLLLTVPAIGLVTTLALLGYGILSEGLGIKGALRSLTVLDQVRREAVAWSTQTLYAGLSPDRLRPRGGTAVDSLDVVRDRWGTSTHRVEIAPDGTLAGALLPSRTPTTLGVVSHGPERARLRFERGADETLVPLCGADFGPAAATAAGGPATLVLCDLDGRFWVRRADGRLEPCAAKLVERVVLDLVQDVLGGADSNADPRQAWENEGPVSRFLGACRGPSDAPLAEGRYVVLLGTPSPAVDTLGLDASLVRRELALGCIGPEDIVD